MLSAQRSYEGSGKGLPSPYTAWKILGKVRPSQTPPKSPSTAMLSRGSLFKKSDVVDDDFFSESVFKCLHSREPKMNVAEYITYRSHCYSYGPIHASFVARRCWRMFFAERRLSLHRWMYDSECRCTRYIKCPKLCNGVSVRRIMFADICDVKSRQPLQKKDVVDDDFFSASVFKCLHSREPKMNVAEHITYRSH